MKKSKLLMLFFTAIMVGASMAFTSCVDDNEDLGMPYLEVSPGELTFAADGTPIGASEFVVKTNRPWKLSIEAGHEGWVRPSITEGKGSAKVSFNIFASNVGQRAKLTFSLYNNQGEYGAQDVYIQQGEIVPEVVVYNENFGTGTASSVAAYTGWDKSGTGSSTVTYGGTGCDIRDNQLSTGTFSNYEGSGGSNLMFGTGNTDFIVQQITLPAGDNGYTLTFGGSYYSAPNIEIYNQLTVHFSADGQTWTSAIPYTFKNFKPAMNWNLATIDFTLKEHSPILYVKFASVKPAGGNYRIDDVKLVTSGGGQEVDLGEVGFVLTTSTPTNVTETGATFTGSVAPLDGVTAVGFQYVANSASIDWTPVAKTPAEAIAASFTKTITGLTAGTTYAVRSYATTADGDKFGPVVTFTPTAAPSGDQITVDFTNLSNYPTGFPTAKGTGTLATYKFGGADFSFFGVVQSSDNSGGYYSSTYNSATVLIWGKTGAYIGLPAVADKALTKVVCTVPDNASASVAVQIGIFDAAGNPVTGGEVITWSKPVGPDRVYTYTLSGTAVNTSYRLQIASLHNAQIGTIELSYGESGSSTDPSISLNPTSLSFPAAADNTGKAITATVTNQGALSLYAESSDPTHFETSVSGNTILVKAKENTTASVKNATVTVYLATTAAGTKVAPKTVAVSQAAAGASTGAIFNTPVGPAPTTSNPFVSDYPSWVKSGSGAANVTFSGTNASVRTSGKANTGAYEGASGPAVVFFGTAPSSFQINNIGLTTSQTKLKLTFGGSRSLQVSGVYDNAFKTETFKLFLSSNGTDWTPITYAVTGGNDAVDPYWIFATSEFTLKTGVTALYVKFEATESSVYRLDDITLDASTTGGQEVDLGGSSLTPTITLNPSSLSFTAAADAAGKTVAVTTTNQAAYSLFVESSDNTNFPATLSGNTVTVTATANAASQARNATVKVYLSTVMGGSRVAEQSISVSQAGTSTPPSGDNVTLTFTDNSQISPSIPVSPGGKDRTAFTLAGTTFYLYADASGKYQWQDNSSYGGAVEPFTGIYIKAGYMELPAVANKKLTAVTITSTGGMGSGVTVGIYDTNDQVVVAAESFTKDTPLTFGLDGAVNTAYRLKVVAGNAQIHKVEMVYSTGGGAATPNITAVNPTSLTWAAAETDAKPIAVTGDNLSGVTLTATSSASTSAFTFSVSGTTVTVTPKATNAGAADITETLTITAPGGNSKTVALTQSKPASGGGAPAAGTVLWSDDFGTFGISNTTFINNKLMSEYDYSGQTLYNPQSESYTVTYTVDANNNVRPTLATSSNMVESNLWFVKSALGEFMTSAIKLYGATKLEFSHAQGTSSSSLESFYSIDGGANWTSLGTQAAPIAKKSYEFTVPTGTTSVMIKLSHPATNSANTRGDNFELVVVE